MSQEVSYVGDPHLGHEFVAGTRGFLVKRTDGKGYNIDVDAHDSAVLNSIIETAPAGSTVVFMGDISIDAGYDYALSLLSNLKHQMDYKFHLIAGNHDRVHPLHGNKVDKVWDAFAGVFDRIQERVMVKDYSRTLYLSHFPVIGDRGRDRYTQWRWPKGVITDNENAWSIHAHTHQEGITDASRERHLCTSWDVKRRPITSSEVKRVVLGQAGKKFYEPLSHWGDQEEFRELAGKLQRHEPLL